MTLQERADIVSLPVAGHCWHCDEQTYTVDLAFEAYICSVECHDAKLQEYYNAMRAAGPLKVSE